MKSLSLVLLIGALVLTACDSDEPDPAPVFGTLLVTVTSPDGESDTFSGNAFAQLDGDALQSLLLSEASEDGQLGRRSVQISPVEPSALISGTYSLGGLIDSESDFTALYSDFSGSVGALNTETGVLTIGSVTETEVRGDFQFEAIGRPFAETGPARYTVSGSFEALVTREPPQ